MYLTREALFQKTERRYRDVDLPNGEKARLQSLNELERAEHNSELLKDDGSVDKEKLKLATCRLLRMMLVDADGNEILHDSDIEVLLQIDSAVMEVIGDAAREHIGWNKDKPEKKS